MIQVMFLESVIPYYLPHSNALEIMDILADFSNPIDKTASDRRMLAIKSVLDGYFLANCPGLLKVIETEIKEMPEGLHVTLSVSKIIDNLCSVNSGVLTFQ